MRKKRQTIKNENEEKKKKDRDDGPKENKRDIKMILGERTLIA